MKAIQEKYRKRKAVYFSLMAAMFGIIFAFRFVPHPEDNGLSPVEIFLVALLFGIVMAMHAVFRCPKCNASLVPGFFSSWRKLRCCPKCGVELTEK
ncbi:MAG TPA: hypothetical protein ENN06_11530 [Desulfobacteraceae bacterium]|nr:hypothetical protein [Desulfobacteraceae bacterium]